ncbi:MAG: tol-pal system protein YbgF [Alphaproteobacteria bacterium RIFCSPHIGHO2_02_FULL_46_13]|nr:MAG: tol-pal system protein YbgF [Alphaproteobacteria bacterium RIFCSPHIGHO2_02_FULL_46_13]
MNFLLSPSTRRISQAAFAACLLMTSVALPASVRADDTDSRLRQLEGSVDTLNRAVFKGEKPPTPLSTTPAATDDYQASVESRISALENELRDLTGKVEKQEYETTQLKANFEKAMADINMRFNDAKAGATPAAGTAARQTGTLAPNDMGGDVPQDTTNPTSLTSPVEQPLDPNAPASQESPTVQKLGSVPVAPGGATIPPTGDDATTQYEAAFSLLKGGNFASAKSGFESFIAKNPKSPLVSNATYWLGESYYANGEFEKAARVFAESYKKYPKGPKVADSLLKMGMSLGASGKKKEGCVALKQLKKEFPSSDTVTLRRADQEIARFACQ